MSRKVYDLNRLRKTYPLRRKRPDYAVVDDSLMENIILEVNDNNQFPYTYNFKNTYIAAPVCILSVENSRTQVLIKSISVSQVILDITGRIPSGGTIKINLQVFKNMSPGS